MIFIEKIDIDQETNLSLYKARENNKIFYVIGEWLCGVLFCPTKRFKGLQQAQKYFNEIK